jgi:hypothetical protein
VQDEQRRILVGAGLKVLGVAVAVGLVIGLGVLVMVKALGLGGDTPSATASTAQGTQAPSALPTVALSSPGSTESSGGASAGPTHHPKKIKPIQLAASPVSVQPGQRINLTGSWPGRDNISLAVQRKENGAWKDFAGVQAQVQVGTFTTYVLTSHTGTNKFRVSDPTTGKVSNTVTVNVG